jgi:hypothetical protein
MPEIIFTYHQRADLPSVHSSAPRGLIEEIPYKKGGSIRETGKICKRERE